ncbi:MAG TPA: glycosidase-like protein, partial [Acidimicrobiia bacterium]
MVTVKRSDLEIRPDPKRVVARPFLPGEAAFSGGPTRVELIAGRVLGLDEAQADKILAETRAEFASRHSDLDAVWEQNFQWAAGMVP